MDDPISRAAALARHSDSPEHYTRTYLTSAHQAAARQIAAWMAEAGMAVRVDAVGNVIGRYEPKPGTDPGFPPGGEIRVRPRFSHVADGLALRLGAQRRQV